MARFTHFLYTRVSGSGSRIHTGTLTMNSGGGHARSAGSGSPIVGTADAGYAPPGDGENPCRSGLVHSTRLVPYDHRDDVLWEQHQRRSANEPAQIRAAQPRLVPN